MLKLSKKTDYAIILLTHLGEAKAPVSAQEVASHYHLPQSMVANILKQLAASGLIESIRGQRGGYILAKIADQITLSEIISITDNPFNLVECVHDEDVCKIYECCPTRRPLLALHRRIQYFMENTTLSNVIGDANLEHTYKEENSYETAHIS